MIEFTVLFPKKFEGELGGGGAYVQNVAKFKNVQNFSPMIVKKHDGEKNKSQ